MLYQINNSKYYTRFQAKKLASKGFGGGFGMERFKAAKYDSLGVSDEDESRSISNIRAQVQ